MEGPGMSSLGLEGEDREERGMIPRAVEQIFRSAKDLEEQGKGFLPSSISNY